MNASYKKEHEQFVSGHEGTSLLEATSVFIVTVAVCLLRESSTFFFSRPESKKLANVSNKSFIRGRFVTDFLILVIPNLLNVTVLSDYVYGNLIVILVTSFILFVYSFAKQDVQLHSFILNKSNLGERKLFVTHFKSLVNLLTAICILAVDFRIFPRRFAKVETYGFGIMDIGVGYFVVSNGIVSPEARNKNVVLQWKKQIMNALLSSLPLITLAFARLLSVKGVDYHEHVTEYGVHWNFFFTLAVLKIFSSLIHILTPWCNPLILGLVIAASHQFFLCQGLSEYIIKGADGQGGRHGIIDANREGMISLPGYFAIYLMSVQLGKFIFWKRHSIKEWLFAVLYLVVYFAVSTALMNVFHNHLESVSRRFCNAAYVLYVIGQSCLVLAVILISEILRTCLLYMQSHNSKGHQFMSSKSETVKLGGKSEDVSYKKISASSALGRRSLYDIDFVRRIDSQESPSNICLLDAISFNSLLFFLLANLLTGFVNMTVSTIHSSHVMSMFVLLSYLLTLCLIAFVLKRKGIATKIW